MKYNFNVEYLYKSVEDPQIDIDALQSENECAEFVAKYKDGNYLDTPSKLLEALNDYESFLLRNGPMHKPCLYYSLLNSKDQTNEFYKEKLTFYENRYDILATQLEFFKLNISKLSSSKQEEFLKYAKLKPFYHFLETLFKNGKYALSEKEENLINLFETPASVNWINLVRELRAKASCVLIIDDKKKKFSYEELMNAEDSIDKKIRDQSARGLTRIRNKNKHIATAEINSMIHAKMISDKLRGFTRPDQSRLLEDDLDSQIMDTLIAAVRSRHDISHRFFELKAKLLGVEKLAYHERYAPIGSVEKSYTYEEAAEIVLKTYESLDMELAGIAKRLIDEDFIDVYPSKGKEGGANCWDTMCGFPAYILLNYASKVSDVVTLAHELGHSVNRELFQKNQMQIYIKDSVATSEVASTFFEDFTLQSIATDLDSSTKLAFIMQKLDHEIDSIFRQIAVYQFEFELHSQFREKLSLSTKEISNLFNKYMMEYVGEYVNNDNGSELDWVHLLHLRLIFYTYSYASGLLISKSLQKMVKSDKSKIETVKEFLRTGSSKSPIDIFADMKIDITDKEFWLKGLDEVDDLLKEAERLADRVK